MHGYSIETVRAVMGREDEMNATGWEKGGKYERRIYIKEKKLQALTSIEKE